LTRPDLSAEECVRRYPRIIRAMRAQAILSESEASEALRDFRRDPNALGGEATTCYGGVRRVLRDAIRWRHEWARTYRWYKRYVYEDIRFVQGDDALEPLQILREYGVEAAFIYMLQWHCPGEHRLLDTLRGGSGDCVYRSGPYRMNWNSPLGYIGLVARVEAP